MSCNINLDANIKHKIQRAKTSMGIRSKRKSHHLQSLSVGSNSSYGKIIKSSWCERYKEQIKKEDIVLNHIIDSKYSLISIKDYIDRKHAYNNSIKIDKSNDLSIELKQYKNLNDSLKNELDEVKNCKICFSNKMDVLCRPCGHLCVCQSCSKRLSKCPICRKDVKQYIKVYMS